jgi:hypothetical protein
MTLNITVSHITSNLTPHTARAADPPEKPFRWTVSWLPPGQLLSYNQAITAMTIAEIVAANIGRIPDCSPEQRAEYIAEQTGSWRLLVDQWASELDMTGVAAIAAAMLRPRNTDRRDVELEFSWAMVARETRDALALLGYPIERLCLPDEIDPCGGTYSQHAAAHLATISAIVSHQIDHLGHGYRGLVSDVYQNEIKTIRAGCKQSRCHS